MKQQDFEPEIPTQEELWEGMPEFVQEKQEPFVKLIVRFRNGDDLQDFSQLINQSLSPKSTSIWFPQLARGIHSSKKYSDEP